MRPASILQRRPSQSRALDILPSTPPATSSSAADAARSSSPNASAFVHRDRLFQLKHALVVRSDAPPADQAAAHHEITAEAAASMVRHGCVAVGEGANMPTTPEAVQLFFEAGVASAPARPPTRAASPPRPWRCSRMRPGSPGPSPTRSAGWTRSARHPRPLPVHGRRVRGAGQLPRRRQRRRLHPRGRRHARPRHGVGERTPRWLTPVEGAPTVHPKPRPGGDRCEHDP